MRALLGSVSQKFSFFFFSLFFLHTFSVSSKSRVWKRSLEIGTLSTQVLEMGGKGDCFFYSVAGAMKTLEPHVHAADLRNLLAKKITRENWEESLYQISDGFVMGVDLETDDVDWLNVFKEQENFPGEPWKLLQLIVKTMASERAVVIERGFFSFTLNYWGNGWALRKLSTDPLFKRVRLIPLNANRAMLGDGVSAKIFEKEEHEEREDPKDLNILLWWNGGHFQLLAKEIFKNGAIRELGSSGIVLKKGALYHERKKRFFAAIWPNEYLPPKIKDLYNKQCEYKIESNE